jgi:DNA repair and recombination protein RAD54B
MDITRFCGKHNLIPASVVFQYSHITRRNFTAKKHKTWDGDGVLSVINGYANLQDVSGREMGRAAWKTPLLSGSTLSIGGKEVEIDSMISKSDFLAGKPFLGGVLPKKDMWLPSQILKKNNSMAIGVQNERELKRAKHALPKSNVFVTSKASTTQFKSPFAKGAKPNPQPRDEPIPRHDPKAPGALIMARPQFVPKGKQIVDVVVDPVLSKHLRQHQREGVQFLYECVMGIRLPEGQGAILADEMGLGKTLQTIALIWTLLKQNPIYEAAPVINKVLVVCPATLVNNWRKEFRKWLGNDRIGVFVADDKKSRITDFTMGRAYNVMIVGYEKLRTLQDDLKKGSGVDLVICDEGHRLKTASNKASLVIKSLNTDRRVILTGTPMQNDLGEFFTMVDLINPGVLNKYNTFKKEFETPIVKSRQPGASQADIEKGDARNQELASLTSLFVLRRTSDVISEYLPPKTESVLFCRPTAAQASIYRAVLQSPAYSAVLGSPETSFQLINVLKKLCNSPSLILGSSAEAEKKNEAIRALLESIPSGLSKLTPAASSKLQLLDSLLHQLQHQTSEKIVIVSNYTSTLDMIQRLITSLSYTFMRLDGQTPTGKRQGLVDSFNKADSSKCFIFLLSAKAGGTGINLIGASRLVLFDVDWNPATDLQAMARIHRDGQKRPCYIYRFLVQGALDEKIYQRQITKTGLSDAVIDAKHTAQGFTTEELRDLFSLDEGETCPTHDLLGCECAGSGNTRVLPESRTEDGIGSTLLWGSTMEDPAADEESNDDDDLPDLGVLVSAAKVNMEDQERKVRKMLRKAYKKGENGEKMLALMHYLHIDANRIRDGDEDLESLLEDQILLRVLREPDSRVNFILSKTSG